ncbi:MAG: hypothetical protein ACOY4N_05635 [Pseudomonadota bacterium]|uniref:Phosphatidate cytidylyltransferase n=1 Tax=Sphingobium xenophagum TaxID=121428 RepID=A0A249MUM0_SPHXE|nr:MULTISPECIES: hypothetical protein [Sphingobium]ASY44837.1 hypothetical protein CJD35_10520 [Sphingobium xenophagum]ODT87217.1 MAG: hypothetical protein ABS86_05310 [Sphingobium sp. SCN 64-10]OUC54025.1 hypothetical protein CA262_03405 [Sphingobium sp. GW456-12-10-14-TSB1]QWT14819.1 hypothetical protein GTV57_03365 [Sphingobium xenophagum]|tara:strand:+ start:317 stop:1192 length:876 start_codon:yes stop_codon:yes gene_type:complete
MSSQLLPLVAAEMLQPADPRAAAMAGAIAAQYPHAARAVLFYGSCLREANLDGLMLDFYLIVSDYRAAYGKSWLARANALIPPNVFPFEHNGLIAKYAVLSEPDFARLCSPAADNVSVWARFAQPSRLLWAVDEDARARAIAAVAQAAPTLLSLALPMAEGQDALSLWKAGFTLTYQAELRAERKGRSLSIVDADPDRYRRFGEAALADGLPPSPEQAAQRWRALQRRGKWLSVVRLAKASFTYAGGIDYLAWKINRHAGTAIVIKPWQRRWPLLGALTLLPRLFRSGSIR